MRLGGALTTGSYAAFMTAGTDFMVLSFAFYGSNIFSTSVLETTEDSTLRSIANNMTWTHDVSLLMFLAASASCNMGESVKPDSGKGYDSFKDYKKENPVKIQGNQQHHIVEQSQIEKSGFSPQQIHNTNNIVELTPEQHSQISGFYSSKTDFSGGLRVRDWLAGKSFDFQYQFGINKLKELGFIK